MGIVSLSLNSHLHIQLDEIRCKIIITVFLPELGALERKQEEICVKQKTRILLF